MITQIDKTVWRGPRPGSMDELSKLGIKQIINLEVGFFEFFHGESGQEEDQAKSAGIKYDHISISDLLAPNQKQIDLVLALMKNGAPTYVHCLHGQDRTGMICAAYRVKAQGWHIDTAISEMFSMGFHKFPYQWLGWVEELREYCE